MLFGFFYYDWTILIVLPAMLFAFWAQINVQSTYSKFSKIYSRSGITGRECAERILRSHGIYNVSIEHINGNLTDHFDPRTNTVRLSDTVYDSTSIAALGVAAHEVGHAIQHAEGYGPIRLRNAIIPATRVGSFLALPIFFIGLLFANDYLLLAGIALFSLSTLFQLITLPVEFNASRRALETLNSTGMLYGDDLTGAKKVLTAAALTYVAALASSLLSLLRLIVIAGGRRRR